MSASTDGAAAEIGDGRVMELSEAVDLAFAPARNPGRVGAEVELIPVTDTDRTAERHHHLKSDTDVLTHRSHPSGTPIRSCLYGDSRSARYLRPSG